MKKAFLAVAALATLLALAADSIAQQGPGPRGGGGGRGWGPGSRYGRLYDPKTVETIEGDVLRVERFTPEKGCPQGVHLVLGTGGGEIPVHLGPAWYLENQETEIQPGDKVEVRGSRVMFEGKPAIIAAEVKRGEDVLVLRDERGVPRWAGWRPGR
jgi:hypothetical protein